MRLCLNKVLYRIVSCAVALMELCKLIYSSFGETLLVGGSYLSDDHPSTKLSGGLQFSDSFVEFLSGIFISYI